MKKGLSKVLMASALGLALAAPVYALEIKSITVDQLTPGTRTITVEAPDFNTSASTAQACVWAINGANRGVVTETGFSTGIFTSAPSYISPGLNIARVTCANPAGQSISKEHSWTTEIVTSSVDIAGPISFIQNNNVANDMHFYAQVKAPEFNLNARYKETFCKMTLIDTVTNFVSAPYEMEETEPNSGIFKTSQITANYSTYLAKISCADREGKLGSIEQSYVLKPLDITAPEISKITPDTYEPGSRTISFTVKDESPINTCLFRIEGTYKFQQATANGDRYQVAGLPISSGSRIVTIRCQDKTVRGNWGEAVKQISFGPGFVAPDEDTTIVRVTSEGRITKVSTNGYPATLTIQMTKAMDIPVHPALSKFLPVKGKKFTTTLDTSLIQKNHTGLYKVGDLVTLTTVFEDPNYAISKVAQTAVNETLALPKNVRAGTISSFSMKRREFKLNDGETTTTITYSNSTQVKMVDQSGKATTVAGDIATGKMVVIRGTQMSKTHFRAATILVFE